MPAAWQQHAKKAVSNQQLTALLSTPLTPCAAIDPATGASRRIRAAPFASLSLGGGAANPLFSLAMARRGAESSELTTSGMGSEEGGPFRGGGGSSASGSSSESEDSLSESEIQFMQR